IGSCPVEHAPFGGEIIFHVDDDDRSSGGIDCDRLRFCVERDRSGLRLRRWSCLQFSAQLETEKCDEKRFKYQALHDAVMLRFLAIQGKDDREPSIRFACGKAPTASGARELSKDLPICRLKSHGQL